MLDTFTLIREDECELEIKVMLDNFRSMFPYHYPYPEVSIVPILQGGWVLSQEIGYPVVPMRMSYYKGTERLAEPQIIMEPEYDELRKNVVLVEAVVDTGDTLLAAKDYILQHRDDVNISCLAVVTKLTKDIGIPITAAYWVHPDLWVMGWGADYNGIGRDLRHIEAFVSPFATEEPKTPLYKSLVKVKF